MIEKKLFLSNGGWPIQSQDFERIESSLNFKFPEAFKTLYLRCNGGEPNLEFWNGSTNYDPFRIEYFSPILTVGEKCPKDYFDLLGFALKMLEKNTIPQNLVPFAFDEADNFICFERDSGSVIYFTADAFQPDVHLSINHLTAQRFLSGSFEDFCSALVAEEDLDF
jgi:hypothetical protein